MPVVFLVWPNLVAAGCVTVGTSVLGAAGQFVFSRRTQPKLLPPRIHGAPTRQLVMFGGALLIFGLANVPLYNASQFLLAHLASAREVAYYAVALTVAGLLAVGPQALSAPLLPALTRVRHDWATLERVYGLALRLLALWIPPVTVILFFAARPVLTLWAGPRYGANSTDPFYIMLGGTILSIVNYVPQTALAAHQWTNLIARFRLCELLPFVAISYLLISSLRSDRRSSRLVVEVRHRGGGIFITRLATRGSDTTRAVCGRSSSRHCARDARSPPRTALRNWRALRVRARCRCSEYLGALGHCMAVGAVG